MKCAGFKKKSEKRKQGRLSASRPRGSAKGWVEGLPSRATTTACQPRDLKFYTFHFAVSEDNAQHHPPGVLRQQEGLAALPRCYHLPTVLRLLHRPTTGCQCTFFWASVKFAKGTGSQVEVIWIKRQEQGGFIGVCETAWKLLQVVQQGTSARYVLPLCTWVFCGPGMLQVQECSESFLSYTLNAFPLCPD